MNTAPLLTRNALLDNMERFGIADPACPECQVFYRAEHPRNVFYPDHQASPRCESGKRPHCTCEVCF